MSHSWRCILAAISLASLEPAGAQQAPPPVVGVEKVERKPITETSEFLGRVQAINRVQLSARVTAFLEKRLFAEGSEVKQGDLLYRLEQGPFEADVQAKQAAVMQIDAQLRNSNLTLDRAQELLRSSAGTQATVDSAQANQLAQSAQLLAAKAQLRQSQINFAYTEIRAPIDGKIGRTATTEGNVVTPTSGVLTTIVTFSGCGRSARHCRTARAMASSGLGSGAGTGLFAYVPGGGRTPGRGSPACAAADRAAKTSGRGGATTPEAIAAARWRSCPCSCKSSAGCRRPSPGCTCCRWWSAC